MKKILTLFIAVMVFGSFFYGCKKAEEVVKKEIKNPDTYIYATIGDVDSLDPCKAYDNASWDTYTCMYETLIEFKGESTSEYVPVLTTEVPTVANGGIVNDGKTFRFKIREGVKFHNGNPLTPEDVEYTFERLMVCDPEGGPGWIWFAMFFGPDYWSSRQDGITFEGIDKAVEVDGDYVVFNFTNAVPYILGVLAGQWAIIVDKEFIVENGGWPGTEGTWKEYNNPKENEETLYEIENGTGPYKMVRWEKGVEFVMERFDGYWGEKPAIGNAIIKVVEEWSTRKLMFLQGDVDDAYVAAMYYDEMDKEEGLTIYTDLPSLSILTSYYNQKIPGKDNPYIGSGKLDGEGIPVDFFSEKNVRLAFSHAWDEKTFTDEICLGYRMDPVTPVPKGLPYKNMSLKNFEYDTDLATEYFKKAWGGKVWEKGFKMEILYNTGNDEREAGVRMLCESLKSINPNFIATARGIQWSEYVDLNRKKMLPLYFMGWLPDYPDPDNFLNPYMYSNGYFANKAGYKNEEADKLILAASIELDPEKRKSAYYRVQEIWLEDAPGVAISQPYGRTYLKDWVKGYFYNPMTPDSITKLKYLKKEY